jgi:hypothetical protein
VPLLSRRCIVARVPGWESHACSRPQDNCLIQSCHRWFALPSHTDVVEQQEQCHGHRACRTFERAPVRRIRRATRGAIAPHEADAGAQIHFFNGTDQFRTTLIGSGGTSDTSLLTRNRWPSDAGV